MITDKSSRIVVALLTVLILGFGSAQFVDVAPCHWAADALNSIAGQQEVERERALASNYLAENSLRQVFEGLNCGDLGWSAYFMSSVPANTVPQGSLEGFELTSLGSSLSGESGRVNFALTAEIDGVSYTRSASADLSFVDGRWQVAYPSLVALGLPLFP